MTEPARPLRVFLCHSSQDKPVVRELYRRLKTENWIDPWLDEEHLLLGQDWDLKIQKELEVADVVIVFISDTSVNKEGYVQKELRLIYDISSYKPEDSIFVIPLRLEDCQPPYRFRLWHWGDYFGDNKENTYQILLRSLKARADELRSKREAEEKKHKEFEELKRKQAEDLNEKARLDVEEKNRKAAEDLKRKQVEEVKEKAHLEALEKERLTAEEIKREQAEDKTRNKEIRYRRTTEDYTFDVSNKMIRRVSPRVSDPNKDKLDFGAIARQLVKPNKSSSPTNVSLDNDAPAKPLSKNAYRLLTYIMLFGIFSLVIGFSWKAFIDLLTNSPPSTSITMPTSVVPTDTITPSPTETSIPSTTMLGVGSTIISPKDDMILLYVPDGEFTMGSDSGGTDEKPIHKVTLDAFWIDQTEVTNAMYAKCVKDGTCKSPSNTNHFSNSSYANHPVVYVNWNQADDYCSWAGRRLPTEAEWEKAARGTDALIYPWGNEAPNKDLLNYNSNVGDTTETGSYETGKSIYGAYDMAGNVWEWVNDWYGNTYYQSSLSSNPVGPDLGISRVLRGGSWVNNDSSVRSASRLSWYEPTNANFDFGFRCSRSP